MCVPIGCPAFWSRHRWCCCLSGVFLPLNSTPLVCCTVFVSEFSMTLTKLLQSHRKHDTIQHVFTGLSSTSHGEQTDLYRQHWCISSLMWLLKRTNLPKSANDRLLIESVSRPDLRPTYWPKHILREEYLLYCKRVRVNQLLSPIYKHCSAHSGKWPCCYNAEDCLQRPDWPLMSFQSHWVRGVWHLRQECGNAARNSFTEVVLLTSTNWQWFTRALYPF